jgi:hypothetical protein
VIFIAIWLKNWAGGRIYRATAAAGIEFWMKEKDLFIKGRYIRTTKVIF